MVNFTTSAPKIGIFRALQLGDLLCSIPAIRAIKKFYPESQISLIGLPWAEEFTNRFSLYFNKFIHFPGFPGLPEQGYSYKSFLYFLHVIKLEQFDLLIQMQGNGTIVNNLLFLCSAKKYAGFYPDYDIKPKNDLFFPYPEDLHEIYKWLFLTKQMGIPTNEDYLEFPLTQQDMFNAKILLQKINSKKYICIHPGARSIHRRIPEKCFADIADMCFRLGFEIVSTGVSQETEISKKILFYMKNKALDLTGKTSLGAAAAIVKNAALIITNDTGMSHVASALQTPSIVLFNSSSPSRWAPLDTSIHKAINAVQISPNFIVETAEKLLSRKNI